MSARGVSQLHRKEISELDIKATPAISVDIVLAIVDREGYSILRLRARMCVKMQSDVPSWWSYRGREGDYVDVGCDTQFTETAGGGGQTFPLASCMLCWVGGLEAEQRDSFEVECVCAGSMQRRG